MIFTDGKNKWNVLVQDDGRFLCTAVSGDVVPWSYFISVIPDSLIPDKQYEVTQLIKQLNEE